MTNDNSKRSELERQLLASVALGPHRVRFWARPGQRVSAVMAAALQEQARAVHVIDVGMPSKRRP